MHPYSCSEELYEDKYGVRGCYSGVRLMVNSGKGAFITPTSFIRGLLEPPGKVASEHEGAIAAGLTPRCPLGP